MAVAGSTHISYVVGKGVSRVKNYTQVLDCISRGNRISEKLSREFINEGLSGLSITYYNKFSFLGIEFQSPNITFSQHDKAAPSTKELKSSMKLALETLGGLYTVWKTIS